MLDRYQQFRPDNKPLREPDFRSRRRQRRTRGFLTLGVATLALGFGVKAATLFPSIDFGSTLATQATDWEHEPQDIVLPIHDGQAKFQLNAGQIAVVTPKFTGNPSGLDTYYVYANTDKVEMFIDVTTHIPFADGEVNLFIYSPGSRLTTDRAMTLITNDIQKQENQVCANNSCSYVIHRMYVNAKGTTEGQPPIRKQKAVTPTPTEVYR